MFTLIFKLELFSNKSAKMRNVYFPIFILLIIVGCKQLDEKVTEVYHKNEFYSAIDNSDNITFRLNKNTENRGTRNDSTFFLKPEYVAENVNNIKKFRNLFNGIKSTDYCCCPNSDVKIEFYNKNKVKDYFFLDYTSSKDSVIVFQKSYQFSKKITKKSWNEYLTKLKKN
jgi:hypothetical protein